MLERNRTLRSLALWPIMAVFASCVAISVQAQSPQVFVSARVGNDVGSCTTALPCRTVTYALTQVQHSGHVLLIDSGDYDSSFVITKSVTIAGAPGVLAVFSNAEPNGSIIGFNPDSAICRISDCLTLILRNLVFDGQRVTQDAVRADGIRLLAEDCTFSRFRFGVLVIGAGTFQFKNCVFQTSEIGIYLTPNGSLRTVLATVEGCRFEALSSGGIEANTGPTGNNTLKLVVRDGFFNRTGLIGVRGNANTGGSIQVDLERCQITNCANAVVSVSPGSVVRISNSTIVGNIAGLQGGGGALLSRGNNTVEGNMSNGNFTGIFFAK